MITKILSAGILVATLTSVTFAAGAVETLPDDAALAVRFTESQFAGVPDTQFPFSFIYDKQASRDLLPQWNPTVADKQLDSVRTERTLSFLDPKTGLQIRCVATQYADFPVVEWVLHIKNTGTADTPILEHVQALDTSLRANGMDDCRLHYAEGSHALITDFRPLEKELAVNDRISLATFGGRSSDGVLPFFNVDLPGDGGVIGAIGWTGQWAAEIARTDVAVRLRAGMEDTHLLLHPGEEIRTPAVMLMFWSGGDRVRSQNLFRAFLLRHCTPSADPPVAMSPHAEVPFEGTTEANTIEIIDRIHAQQLPIDYWWIDAGWYDCDKNWARWVGNWKPSPDRFPNGLKPMADSAHGKGYKFLLWFEPERVMPDTLLYKEHPDWLMAPPPAESLPADLRYMANDGFHLLNLGNPDALAWAKQYVGGMIGELGIDCYRNDFNMYPVYYWRNGEAPDRRGINEIRYVTGLYDYFDTLAREHPGLLLDNCASGGRRIDFELLRRSLVLTRSDYLWDPIGQQCHTYGLAQWIPLTGIGAASTQPYECRSGMGAHYALAINTASTDSAAWKSVNTFLDSYQAIRPLFRGDFYPLSPYSTDPKEWLAFQFDRSDLGQGVVQVFRRAECPDAAYTCHLQGLDPDKTYTLTDWDNTPPQTLTGRELLEKGVTIPVKDKPAAAVVVYVEDQKVLRLSEDVTVRELTDGIWLHTTYFDVPKLGRYPANGLVVLDGDNAVIIDLPWTDEETAVLFDWVSQARHATVRTVVPMHSHKDCSGGLGEAHRRGADSLSLRLTADLLKKTGGPVPHRVFDEKAELNWGQTRIELAYHGPGHAIDNIVAWIPDKGILFGGCLVKAGAATELGNITEADLNRYPETLKALKSSYSGARVVVPGHGEPGDLGVIDHTLALCAKALTGVGTLR